MAEFEFGLDEVRLQPVDCRARQLACADRLCTRAGNRFAGPAIVEQMDSTTVLLPGMTATVEPYLNLILEMP